MKRILIGIAVTLLFGPAAAESPLDRIQGTANSWPGPILCWRSTPLRRS